MSSKPAQTVAEEVASRARGLNHYTQRLERLYDDGDIIKVDIRRVYEGALVNFYSFVERSIERLFLGLLMGRFQSERKDVRALVDIKSENVARSVVKGGRSYVDWLPYNRSTRRRAKAFFSRGRPFTRLTRSEGRNFQRIAIIRNAIAHRSSYSRRRFREQFTEGKALPPSQRSPAGYLRGQHAAGQTRLEAEFGQVLVLMQKMCE